ncbi:MAG: DUF4625 domain-containing protein [Cyclobacteriaceae bacterium]
MKKLLTLVLGAVLFAVSCDSDDDQVDTTAPTITLNEPENGERFAAGGTLHFDAVFEDDIALATYNVDVHNNFDGHSHGRIAVAEFDFEQSYTISGRLFDTHEDITISTDATAGPYDFVVKAIDAAGNSTTFTDASSKLVEIWITNEEMAHVHFQDANGAEVEEFEGEVGTPLQFYGEIEDESGSLEHVTILFGHGEEAGDHDHGGRVAEDDDHIYEEEFEVEGETSVMIQDLLANASIVATQEQLDELEEGEHLFLTVNVEDEAGNLSEFSIEVHFD